MEMFRHMPELRREIVVDEQNLHLTLQDTRDPRTRHSAPPGESLRAPPVRKRNGARIHRLSRR